MCVPARWVHSSTAETIIHSTGSKGNGEGEREKQRGLLWQAEKVRRERWRHGQRASETPDHVVMEWCLRRPVSVCLSWLSCMEGMELTVCTLKICSALHTHCRCTLSQDSRDCCSACLNDWWAFICWFASLSYMDCNMTVFATFVHKSKHRKKTRQC